MPEHVRDSWARFRYSWSHADLQVKRELLGEIAVHFYVDPERRRLIGFKPTPEYADYFAVDPDSDMVDVDWTVWAFGRKPTPTWAKYREEPADEAAHAETSRINLERAMRGVEEHFANQEGLQARGWR